MANLNQVEITVGPSQFRSTASPVRRVPAKGVVGRLNYLRLTLLSGVFVCDCEIDISNWCIQMVGSALPQFKVPGMKLSIAISRLKFSVLTFYVIWGRVSEHSFNKRVMSRSGWAIEGCYLIVGCWLSCYHEIFRSSNIGSAHNTLKLIVNPEEYECHLNNVVLVATNNITKYIDICSQ